MNDDQITALAREYAEWVTESEGGSNAHIPAETAIASALLRWLCKRFCLVEKSKVQAVYKTSKEIVNNELYGTCKYSMHKQIMCVLENLFGSKCLPDEEKPQPQFHKGDKVKVITDCWKDKVYTVTDVKEIYPQFSYKLSCSPTTWFTESTLELYTEESKRAEPTENKVGGIDNKAIKPIEEHFDTILKDGFSKERRLTIASMAMQAILISERREHATLSQNEIAELSLGYAEALIAEAKKKGGLK